MAPRRPRKVTIVFAANASPANQALGWQAFGASVANYTVQWLQLPGNNQYAAPGSRGTFAMDGQETGQLQWGAPPGTPQPAAIAGQSAVVTFTEEPLPDNGGPLQLSTTVASFVDGTAAAPGLFATAETTTGLFHTSPGVLGFSILGVEQARINANGLLLTNGVAPGSAAAPGIPFNGDLTTGLYRIAASRLGFTLGGAIGFDFARTGTGAMGLQFVSVSSGGTPDINAFGVDASINMSLTPKGSGAVTTPNAFAIGALPAQNGALRLPNAGWIEGRNVGNTADVTIFRIDTGNNLILDNNGGGLTLIENGGVEMFRLNGASFVDFRVGDTALGGGAAPTFGTIGGTGPAVAAQNRWLKIMINGTASYIPIWR